MKKHADPVMVGAYEDGFNILRNDLFRVDHPFRSTRQIFGASVLDTEGETHILRKRGWLSAFSKQALAAPEIQAIIEESVVEGLAVARDFNDLMVAATFIPNRVVLRMLGCDDIDPMEHAKRTHPAIEYLETNMKTPEALAAKDYLRQGPFKSAEGLMQGIPEKERVAELMLFAVAGAETTAVAMKILLQHWALNHEDFKRDRNDLSEDGLILKLLREDPPLGLATRYCSAETVIGDRTYSKGDIVHVDLVEANKRCPHSAGAAKADLTFGSGKHSCPGHLLAKAELASLVRHLDTVRHDDFFLEQTDPAPRPMNFRHPNGLAIRFRAAHA